MVIKRELIYVYNILMKSLFQVLDGFFLGYCHGKVPLGSCQ